MRLRNVKNAKEQIESSSYILLEPKEFRGNFRKLFDNDNPIYIEIGMGKGQFIINNALKYPNINFIGIEKYDSVIVRAIQKIGNMDIPNLKLIRMDALEINDVFDKEIDRIYLNFSDPWPKDRHEHRRLSSIKFLEKYDLIFKDIKNIVMKTDNRKLFEFSIRSFNNYGYKIEDISLDLYNDDHELNIPTEYEDRFVSRGQVIYMIDVTK
ncbi:MAG: tRNA (guanosine(46)-N7)-methyltransferase TrmB [Firmicutes bacterium]|nr:tRNA (guanosine(46)-N7)-methyltransferase TrmB [Bacillota bacterium]